MEAWRRTEGIDPHESLRAFAEQWYPNPSRDTAADDADAALADWHARWRSVAIVAAAAWARTNPPPMPGTHVAPLDLTYRTAESEPAPRMAA